MYRVLKRMQDGVNLYISSGTSLGVLKRAQDAVNLYSSSGTRYVDGDIQFMPAKEVLEDLACALTDKVSTTRFINLLNKPYSCRIKRNLLERGHFVTSESVFLDTLYRLQDSKGWDFFSFLLHKRVIISKRIQPKLDVYAITLCSWVCPPNRFIKLNSDSSFKDGVGGGGGGGVLRDHLGLVRGIYSVPFAHCNSAFEAEVRSLSIGLTKAFKMGIRDLIVELDSIDVVQVLQGSRALSSLEREILRELPIKEFNYICSSVLRESNEAANLLAVLAKGSFTTPSMLEEMRYKAWRKVMQQCQRDVEGDTYFRLRYLRENESSYIPTSLTSERNLQILNLSPNSLSGRVGNVSDGLMNIKKRYLHSTCLPPVTHSNLKAANILLHELMPRLSGCGLAVLRPITSNSIKLKASEMAIGNTGYVAPERIQNGFESAKGNTYAFGLLLLKLSTGKRPLHGLRPQEEQSLVKWASSWLRYNESLEKMVDPNIQKPLWSRALSRSAVIVSLCVQNTQNPEIANDN